MRLLFVLTGGLIFGFGLALSGMAKPEIILGFLHLQDALSENRSVIAWVDRASMPYSGAAHAYSGGSYHVLAVYRMGEKGGTALIGDLAEDPIEVSLSDLQKARARIKKQKNRIMTVGKPNAPLDLSGAVAAGHRADKPDKAWPVMGGMSCNT